MPDDRQALVGRRASVVGETVDVLYAHGFKVAAEEVDAGRRGIYWAAWHVERRIEVYGDRARRCLAALRRLDAEGHKNEASA